MFPTVIIRIPTRVDHAMPACPICMKVEISGTLKAKKMRLGMQISES